MYGGTYQGDITLDASGAVPRASFDEHVSGIDFAMLFKDLFDSRRLAFWSLLALNLTLLYQIYGIGPTPDSPLLFAWVGAIWVVRCATCCWAWLPKTLMWPPMPRPSRSRACFGVRSSSGGAFASCM